MTLVRAKDIAKGVAETLPYLPVIPFWLAWMAGALLLDIAYHEGWLQVRTRREIAERRGRLTRWMS